MGIAIPGTKVRFLNENGYEGERSHAAKKLEAGCEYIVARVDVGDWTSYYQLEGIPHFWNTVMFAEVK